MAKKNDKIIDAEVVKKEVKEIKEIKEVDLTEAAQALAQFKSSPDAEDLLFANMDKDKRKKYGLSLSTQQLEERHTASRQDMNNNRIEYALTSTRLVTRQAWREPQEDGNPSSRIDYFENKLGDSYNTVDRHVKAVLCLVMMGQDPSELNHYRYRRLAAFYDKIEKNVATRDDFNDLEPKMVEMPEEQQHRLTDKEFDNEMKQRFGEREAALRAEAGEDPSALKRLFFEVPANQEKMVDDAHRLGMDLAKKEGRNRPSLGNVIIEALTAWHMKMGHDMKYISAEYARQALQEVYKIALIPFRIHKFQKTDGLEGLPTMRVFRVGDYFVLEEEPRHAAKALNVKVDQLQEVRVNVSSYLIRTGMMEVTDEEVKKAQEVLEKPLEAPGAVKAPPKAKKAKAGKPEASEEVPDDTDEAPKKKRGRPRKNQLKLVKDEEPKAEKKPKAEKAAKPKKKLSEMTANEISLTITKMRQKLELSDEDYKAMSEGKEPKQVLRELVELQKSSA